MPQNIVSGQKITAEKKALSKELRKHMTPEEGIIWKALRNRQLLGFKFRRQQIVHGFIADFYCHEAALVVEIDGPVHHDSIEHDQERDAIFASHGIAVFRLPNSEVRSNLAGVMHGIVSQCRERFEL